METQRAQRLARPLCDRARPRVRAAFPLAPVDRLPVSPPIASSRRPAQVSALPAARSFRDDLMRVLLSARVRGLSFVQLELSPRTAAAARPNRRRQSRLPT